MKDRYLFRAKRIDNGEWVEGFLVKKHGLFFIYSVINSDTCRQPNCEVDPSTICQCTGLKDKNGNLIFEHDIIKCKGIITAVSWNTKYASWVLTRKGWMHHHFFGESQDSEECEVIGNVFDNPELMEQED